MLFINNVSAFYENMGGRRRFVPIQYGYYFCLYFYFLNIGSIRAVYHDAQAYGGRQGIERF